MSTILLVDDDEMLRKTLRLYLMGHGHRVTDFALGSEAFKWLDAHRADSLLVDQNLPDMPGCEVVSYAVKHGRVCKAVLMTGLPPPPHLSGVEAVLLKPFTPRDLQAVLT